MPESYLEGIAVLTALIYVVLAAKTKRICFLFGFISSAIYIYICLGLKFYFDALINLFYVVVSIVGWFKWKSSSPENFVLSLKKSVVFLTIIFGLALTIVLAVFADRFSNASLPYLDAFTTVFSLIASYLLLKRYKVNWLFWIIIDLVAAYMYYVKALELTSLLFLFYTVLAAYGYYSWHKLEKR